MNFDLDPTGGTTSFPDENQLFQPLYDSEAFADFEQAMDDMLEALVGRWVHLAAPGGGNWPAAGNDQAVAENEEGQVSFPRIFEQAVSFTDRGDIREGWFAAGSWVAIHFVVERA